MKLTLAEYRKWADVATDALHRVPQFLHGERIFKARDLPVRHSDCPTCSGLCHSGRLGRTSRKSTTPASMVLVRGFGEMYGGSTETRFANDLMDCVDWVSNDGPSPRTVRDSQFQAERLLTLRSRNSAAYKGLYALQMKRGGNDFRTGDTIDLHAYFDEGIEIHHIFPQKWCVANKIERGVADCVVNKTAISAHTNRKIGGNAPSMYLHKIESEDGLDTQDLDATLQSHDIDPLTLRQDDFTAFFNHRFERLLRQIEEATGKSVNRSSDGTDSPFAEATEDNAAVEESIRKLLESGESRVVEFKSTGRKNMHSGQKDPDIEWAVVKSIAGFMNSHGGTLLVGVADDGTVVGIEQDFPFLKAPDTDRWELWLTDLISKTLGKLAATELIVRFAGFGDGSIAKIDVGPGVEPVFATPSKGEKRETSSPA